MSRASGAARVTRWLPAAIIPAVIVAGAVIAPLGATAAVDLPDIGPAELLELVSTSDADAFSARIEQKSELGLPDLSGLSGANGSGASGSGSSGSEPGIASVLELVTGSHSARVFVDGPGLARMQVFDQLAERNIVRNGNEVWLYDSSDRTATHLVFPAEIGGRADEVMPDAGAVPTPGELADRVLAELDATTAVTVGTDATVAGRSAYELVLTPRDTRTLVGSVSIAVDSETGLPLAFEILARGQDVPALRVAFTELTLESPDADLFAFEPPPGAAVTEHTVTEGPKPDHTTTDTPDYTVSGAGWSSILELPAAGLPADLIESPLSVAATELVDGGRLLSTALVNVLMTDDGRVFAGAVSPEQLLDAAAGR